MFRNRFLQKSLTLVTSMLILVSCQEVIDIDLNSSDPRLVVEGAISSTDSVTWVRLTRSVNFDEPNSFPGVVNAQVSVTDSKGVTTPLLEEFLFVNDEGASIEEITPSFYRAHLKGVVGETYTLNIIENDKSYSTTTVLNPPVAIDTIFVQSTNGFNPPELPSEFMNCSFYDPKGEVNQYRFIQSINGVDDNYIYVGNDTFFNGIYVNASLFGSEKGFVKGDTVVVKLQTIDTGNYNYLQALSRMIGGGGESVSPTNPPSNFTGDAMGYFYAYSEDRDTIIIK